MHDQYDLVKVKDIGDADLNGLDFEGAIGIVEEVDQDIDGDTLYKLLFVGKYHNELSRRVGTIMFYDNELEGI